MYVKTANTLLGIPFYLQNCHWLGYRTRSRVFAGFYLCRRHCSVSLPPWLLTFQTKNNASVPVSGKVQGGWTSGKGTVMASWVQSKCSEDDLQNLVERCEGLKPATRGGGWMGADQNFFKIWIVGLYPENHPNPQAFWPKFGIAMEELNQHKRPRTSERNQEVNRKRIGKTAELICLDRSDRCAGPVWPVLPTGLTGGTQKTLENLDSNGESRPNDHENRWNLGDCFAPTLWTYPQKISS